MNPPHDVGTTMPLTNRNTNLQIITVPDLSTTVLHLPASPQRETSTIGYRADIDGLRAVAAISVVMAHAGWLPGGTYGVDIFFVISGFLISGIVLNAINTAEFSFIDFYARRVKRIFPALIAVLVATWILGWLVLPSKHYTLLKEDIAAAAGFAQNLWMYFGPQRPTTLSDTLLAHLWTLGIEEQFYLAWPLLLWVAARLKGLTVMIVVAVALSLFSFNWLLLTRNGAQFWSDSAAFLLPWNRLWELGLGGLLACIQRSRTNTIFSDDVSNAMLKRLAKGSLGMIGATCIFVCLLSPVTWPAAETCAAVVGSFLLIAAGPQCWINRHFLCARPLVFVGLVSYPLYLWHQPLLRFCDIVYVGNSPSDLSPLHIRFAAIIVAFILSCLTYRYIELPLRPSRRTHEVAIILSVVMACCGAVAYLTSV